MKNKTVAPVMSKKIKVNGVQVTPVTDTPDGNGIFFPCGEKKEPDDVWRIQSKSGKETGMPKYESRKEERRPVNIKRRKK